MRYDNVPTSSGAVVTRSGNNLFPDANGNLNAVDNGDIFWSTDAPHRMLLVINRAQLRLFAFVARRPCVGRDPTGRDRVDANVGTKAIRERVRERDDAALRCCRARRP